jgi:hypothetical protein
MTTPEGMVLAPWAIVVAVRAMVSITKSVGLEGMISPGTPRTLRLR